MLEKAGATAVVPEILEPSLQLAAAVLSQVGQRWLKVMHEIWEVKLCSWD